MENVTNIENVSSESNEVPVENIEKKSSGFKHSDYKSILDMIKSMDEQLKSLKDMSTGLIRNTYHLKTEILDDIIRYTKKELEEMEIDKIKEILIPYTIDSEDIDDINQMEDDEIRKEIIEIKNSSLVYLSAKVEADNLKNESNDILSEYMNYMTSDKAREAKKKNLETMKKSLDTESSEKNKKEIQDMINVMESSLNYDFLYYRFNELKDKEVDNIKEGFFNNKKGDYIMTRTRNRLRMFGFKEDMYKYFLNIEETFLDEKYHPFNNLFLFIYSRMIAYSDPYNKKDKIFVNAINSGLASLIYHKFESTEQELYFKKVIMNILDHFMDDRDYFIENNTTYENHPTRIAFESENKDKMKSYFIKELNKINVTDIDENLDEDQLKELYYEKYNELVLSQVEEYNKEKKEEENDEITESDGETSSETEKSESSTEDTEESKVETEEVENKDSMVINL